MQGIWALKSIIFFFKMGGIVAGFYAVRSDLVEEEALMIAGIIRAKSLTR